MLETKPLSTTQYDVMMSNFKEYMVVGGMPAIVNRFVTQKNYRLYFADTGILIGSLDEEAQDDLRKNENFNTYKGTIYENVVGDMLVKAGYKLYFYKIGLLLYNLNS